MTLGPVTRDDEKRMCTRRSTHATSYAGLTRVSIHFARVVAAKMDGRVKPGHDDRVQFSNRAAAAVAPGEAVRTDAARADHHRRGRGDHDARCDHAGRDDHRAAIGPASAVGAAMKTGAAS